MNAVYFVLFVQALLGGFDNLWHHELGARLPQRATAARRELSLHAAREAIYGALFIGLAWCEWHGLWLLLPAVLLATEVVTTCADFLEEDRSRTLPPLERLLHTVLAVSFGLLLGLLVPVFTLWWRDSTRLVAVDHAAVSWFFSCCGLGVTLWGVRNAGAALRTEHAQPSVKSEERMRSSPAPAVLVTGGTGFIGAALVRRLVAQNRRVILLTRDVRQARRLFADNVWAIDRLADVPAETRIESVIHLAGATVLGMPWTRARRRVLIESRTRTMQDVLALMRRLREPPRVLISASAVGYYGVQALDAHLDERGAAHPGCFQSDLCVAAEHEAQRAEGLGVRVVRLRFGIVLGHGGGAFPGLALAARLGVAMRIGTGLQPAAWIHLDDAISLVTFAMERPGLQGPINAVAPDAVTQGQFARALARAYGRGVHLCAPASLLRWTLGEMSELLTCGQCAEPVAAVQAGFVFQYTSLGRALESLVSVRE